MNDQHLEALASLLEVGKAVWPEPKQLDAEAAAILNQVLRESASDTPTIPGML